MAMLRHCDHARIAATFVLIGPAIVLALTSRIGGQSESPPQNNDWAAFQKTVQPFLAKHCFACHDKTEKGDVRLDSFEDEGALVKGLATVEKAMSMLRKHAMPPKKQPQPTEDETNPVLDWMQSFIARMDRELPADPGAPVVRRLNRVEYNNTVRDLLGVIFRPADDFPQDVSGHGFDNIGGTLSVTPTLMEKYLAAAEKVARTAVFGVEPMKPERTAHQPYFTADAFSKNKQPKLDYDETGMSLKSALHVVQQFPVDGEYALRTVLRGSRPAGSDPMHVGIWIDGKLVHEAEIAIKGSEVNGQRADFRTRVTAGEHWLSVTLLKMFEGLPAAYKGPKPSSAKGGTGIGVDAWFPMYLDVVGPYEQATGPSDASLKKIFPKGAINGKPEASAVREIVANLSRRAYRRPVTNKEVDDLVKLVAMVQNDGDSIEDGLCLAIQRMLISPHFLFRLETARAPEKDKHVFPVSQHELATRLSYFLWSSMPDEELSRCADEQQLQKPPVLEAQVRRMLKDPKALALVENFGGQWLLTRALESHTPERAKFVEFTDYTRMSMKKETDLFFEHIVREDRSILDFLDANYTFLNERLADFYGIGGVKGHEFRKVNLTGTQRGGILTQASVLTVSSYANRTSPVLRGKWILENLINAPPPAPPANVPILDEEPLGKSVSLREQLEKHRSNPSCATCHARMDPLGFALEHFDAIGRWRDKDGNFDIETAGTLPDGRSFKGYEELQALLKSDARAFTECLAGKMLMYALGRGLEPSDRATIRAIADKVAKEDYRFSSLVLGIVQSVPFQMRKRL
jgi:hypothetical protein